MIDAVARLGTPGGTFTALVRGPTEGPVVLFLHGFPDTPRSFDPVRSRLAEAGLRTVAPFARGYHPSTTAGPFDVDRLAEDVVELADAVSPHAPVHLVGHDWGAVAAYAALGRWPARFAASVALAIPHPLAFLANAARSGAQLRRSGYMLWFQLPFLPERTLAANDFAYVDRLWRAWSPGLSPDAARAPLAAAKATLAESLPGPLGPYRALTRPPVAAVARVRAAMRPERHVHTPVLQIVGADDGCIAPEAGDGQERWFAHRALVREVWPDVGHFLHLEAPDALADRILRHVGAAGVGHA